MLTTTITNFVPCVKTILSNAHPIVIGGQIDITDENKELKYR